MTSIELPVEEGGIPHLAKNERDVGHPAFVAGTGNPFISLPTRLSESAARDDKGGITVRYRVVAGRRVVSSPWVGRRPRSTPCGNHFLSNRCPLPLSSRASDLPVASHRQVKRGMNWETSGPFDTRVPSPLATALSLSTTLSYLSFRAKRGTCGAPRSLPDSQGQTYRQFKPSLFVPRHHCFYLQTHFVH